jgi:hypothetical protein
MTREEAIDILVKRSDALRKELTANDVALLAMMREKRRETNEQAVKFQAGEPCAE